MRVRFDGFVLDTERKHLCRGEAPVRLTPRAYRLLSYLIAERARAVSKRELLEQIWSGSIVEEANLKTLVLEIRGALEERGATRDAIRTVFGFGYAFAGDVVDEPEAAASEALIRVEVQQRTIFLPAGVHDIGRLAGCAVFIDAASVSRVHARLHVSRDKLLVEDHASKNGTFVGDVRVTTLTPLPRGAELRCGDVRLRVERLGRGATETETVDV